MGTGRLRRIVTAGLVGAVLAGSVATRSDGLAGPGKDGQVQVGTPAAASLAAPDPTECVVAPRTPDGLRSLAPGGRREDTQARPSVVVNPAVLAQVAAAVRLYVACLNTGDDYRLYGMLTDDDLRMIPAGEGFLVDDGPLLDAKATPVPIRWGFLSPMPTILSMDALGNGRVAADIVFSRPEGERRTTLVWVDVNGRWLVDEERASVDRELRPRNVEDFQA